MTEKKTFHITTFGCQMNEHDSEIMAGLLLKKGYAQAASREAADIVIFNTCSIRENADKRFVGTLGQLKRRKLREGDAFTVCVCGCMMQQQHIVDKLKAKYPWVDVVYGTHNLYRLPELLDKLYQEKKKQLEVWPEAAGIVEDLPAQRLYAHKSFVNIMYGCNNFCSYCIVPYTRGRERSRSPEDIVREVRALVRDGVREITLLGQNVNSYRAPGAETDFTDLIYMLAEIEGLLRIRFMTSHPKDLSDKLIEAFSRCDKLCKHFHLPVQAGSDKVLRDMNRRYTQSSYLRLVDKLRAACPDISLSTDIIVGFPGETEEDFAATLALAERVGYDSAFTFLYSIRPGTPAAARTDQVPEEVKHERFNRLVDVINKSAAAKNAAYVGRTVAVLTDGKSRSSDCAYEGRTDSFKLVNFTAPADLAACSPVGRIVRVKITDANTFSLKGEMVE